MTLAATSSNSSPRSPPPPDLPALSGLITAALPDAIAEIKWNVPAYSTGTVLVTFAGFTKHLNLYLTSGTMMAFERALTEYRTGKSAISFRYDQTLPEQLIGDLLAHRPIEYTHDGITWM